MPQLLISVSGTTATVTGLDIRVTVSVRNSGTNPLTAELAFNDSERKCLANVSSPAVALLPGASTVLQLDATVDPAGKCSQLHFPWQVAPAGTPIPQEFMANETFLAAQPRSLFVP